MCGVFGFIAAAGKKVNMERLAAIARVTERRGPHAFGFAWVDSRGRTRMYKQTGRVSDHVAVLAMAADARMLIGHCRFATHGSPENNLNNHPHPCDGGWIVHNGVARHHAELAERHALAPVTQCDSEVIAQMIERFDGSLADRCGAAVSELEGSPAVVMGLWAHPLRLVAVRSGNPLHMGRAASGIYLASLREAMPRNVRQVKDGSTIVFRFDDKGQPHGKEISIAKRSTARAHETWDAADEGGGRRAEASLFEGGDDRDCSVPVHEGATRKFAIKSKRTYGF